VEADISDAIKLGVHKVRFGQLVVTTHRKSGKVNHYARVISRMFRKEISAGRPVRWLDVGAGYGEVLEAASRVLPAGSYIEGIEPMAAKVFVARSRGLPVSDMPISEIRERFDVISLINVFSHIPNFRSFTMQFHERMTDRGVLFLETGNGADLKSRADYPDMLYLPDHLVFAGRSQLEAMLKMSGFVPEDVQVGRVDTPLWALKLAMKSLKSGRVILRMPYASQFRTMYLKARRILPEQ
jgi:SAM-dependent methyltransferase